MYKLSPWITEYYNGLPCGSMRIVEGTDHTDIKNRVAFIEKTPRIRIRPQYLTNYPDFLNWAERPFSGDGPLDDESKKWCDDMLRVMGYQFPLEEAPKSARSYGVMTRDQYGIIDVSENEMFVAATYSGMSMKWPHILTDKDTGRKYEFQCNDVLPVEMIGMYSGYAKYKRIP